ncbi:MAG: (2Fe-2S)-binding protein [Elusimicrobiales bacterium]|nr:(2Fe-2S)-binding protein [Elusimicrobiales bacterium]
MKKNRSRLEAAGGFFGITLSVNGVERAFRVRNSEFLLDALRRYGYKSVKKGCDTGDCGSCTVIVDGKPSLACLIPAFSVHGSAVTTVEGLGTMRAPHPLQTAFVEAGAVQCGFCVPGMILSAKALLDEVPDPSEAEIKKYLDGNLCRCTGYVKQVRAVKAAAKKKRGGMEA